MCSEVTAERVTGAIRPVVVSELNCVGHKCSYSSSRMQQ